jgi:hypothetical protein
MQDFFPWLAQWIGYDCFNQGEREERRGDSQIPSNDSTDDRCRDEDRHEPLKAERVQLVRGFSPVQQGVATNAYTGVLPEYRQFLTEIELIAQICRRFKIGDASIRERQIRSKEVADADRVLFGRRLRPIVSVRLPPGPE